MCEAEDAEGLGEGCAPDEWAHRGGRKPLDLWAFGSILLSSHSLSLSTGTYLSDVWHGVGPAEDVRPRTEEPRSVPTVPPQKVLAIRGILAAPLPTFPRLAYEASSTHGKVEETSVPG